MYNVQPPRPSSYVGSATRLAGFSSQVPDESHYASVFAPRSTQVRVVQGLSGGLCSFFDSVGRVLERILETCFGI